MGRAAPDCPVGAGVQHHVVLKTPPATSVADAPKIYSSISKLATVSQAPFSASPLATVAHTAPNPTKTRGEMKTMAIHHPDVSPQMSIRKKTSWKVAAAATTPSIAVAIRRLKNGARSTGSGRREPTLIFMLPQYRPAAAAVGDDRPLRARFAARYCADMEQVAESLYRLGRKHHNFYLIVEGGRATVIDAGGSRELPLLEAGLAALGLALDDVEALLITHAHTDHIGFARQVSRRGISVKVHEAEAAYAMDGAAGTQVGVADLPMWKPRAIVFVFEMIRAGAHRGYRLKDVETVADGDRLDLPGRPRVVGTPGHTAGHASYLIEDRRALCAGDALVTDGLIRPRAGPQLLPEMFHTDPEKAAESLQRLVELEADLVLPGHGDPWRGSLADAVAQARQ